MSARRSAVVIAAAAAVLSAPIATADVKLENGWLRPAYAGQPAAMVYVDIRSTEVLKLIDAKSPIAKGAQLVLVDPPGSEPERHKVVKELPVAANQSTRLAFLGNHVRLLDIRQDLPPGSTIPLVLTFVDEAHAPRRVHRGGSSRHRGPAPRAHWGRLGTKMTLI
jgi:periplasmic copper chaperone A